MSFHFIASSHFHSYNHDESFAEALKEVLEVTLPQKAPLLSSLSLFFPEDFTSWKSLLCLPPIKSVSLHFHKSQSVLGLASLDCATQTDLENILNHVQSHLPPTVGLNFSLKRSFPHPNDAKKFDGSPLRMALRVGCDISFIKLLISKGNIDLSQEIMLPLIKEASTTDRLDVVRLLIEDHRFTPLGHGPELVRFLLQKSAETVFAFLFEGLWSDAIERGDFATLFQDDPEFYTVSVFQCVNSQRLEWMLQRQKSFGINFVSQIHGTVFGTQTNSIGHAVYQWKIFPTKFPWSIDLILKYNSAAALFRTPPQLVAVEPNDDDDDEDEAKEPPLRISPMRAWSMSQSDICYMIGEGPTEPWEQAQLHLLEHMFDHYLEAILSVDRSSIDAIVSLLQPTRDDLALKIRAFEQANPLSSP